MENNEIDQTTTSAKKQAITGKEHALTKKVYSKLADLPEGSADGDVIKGCCIVLEGGAFRGVYTSGVLDALMEAGVMCECTIGVSAGALNGLNYVSGQIGRSGRINLTYRHDKRYVGLACRKTDGGVIGFDFVLHQINEWDPFDFSVFNRPERRFIAVAANLATGKTEYYEKGVCPDIFKAVQASASMPYVSKPVLVDGVPCLDGGCTDKIPFEWAMERYEKVIVVKTRQDEYRKKDKKSAGRMARLFYKKKYPLFAEALADCDRMYNRKCDEIETLKQSGKLFVIRPSGPLTVGRVEKDMEKLGAFYTLGYTDGKAALPALKTYLGID